MRPVNEMGSCADQDPWIVPALMADIIHALRTPHLTAAPVRAFLYPFYGVSFSPNTVVFTPPCFWFGISKPMMTKHTLKYIDPSSVKKA
jgi:hypothetical protein